jgi:outer membrane lipoprotein LolB
LTQQSQQTYTLSLVGPLTSGSAEIKAQAGSVRMETSKGEVLQANDAQSLLAKKFGLNLPVQHLYYWLRGLPVPGLGFSNSPSQGTYHHIAQAGWSIDYQDYQKVSGYLLPKRLQINRGDLTLKLSINHWQLLDTADE